MKIKLALCALGLALFQPTTTLAQSAEEPLITVIGAASRQGLTSATGLGSRPVPADPETYRNMAKADSVRAVMIDFAQCLHRKDRAGVMKFSDMVPGTKGFGMAAKALADNQCMAVGDMAFRPSMLYGASYIVRYRERYRLAMPALGANPVDFTTLARSLSGDPLQLYVSSRRFGDCVARRDTKTAHELVVAAPGSTAEAAAFGAIGPSLSACLAQGSELALTKDFIKGVLAEVLVRSAA